VLVEKALGKQLVSRRWTEARGCRGQRTARYLSPALAQQCQVSSTSFVTNGSDSRSVIYLQRRQNDASPADFLAPQTNARRAYNEEVESCDGKHRREVGRLARANPSPVTIAMDLFGYRTERRQRTTSNRPALVTICLLDSLAFFIGSSLNRRKDGKEDFCTKRKKTSHRILLLHPPQAGIAVACGTDDVLWALQP